MKLSAYSDSSAGIVGRPKRSIGRSAAADGPGARGAGAPRRARPGPPRMRRSCRAAGRARPRPAHHEPDGQRDREQHVGEAGGEVSAGALVEAEQRHQQLVVREHPQPADRDQHQLRLARDRATAPTAGPRTAATSSAPTVIAISRKADEVSHDLSSRRRLRSSRLVVEAQQRLDDAEAQQDAERDDGRQQHLRGAVVGARQVARVEGQQRDREQLRDHARGRVRGAGAREPL